MNYLNFYTGKEFEAHEFLGAHVDDNGVLFRVYAPSASHVAVIGEFNGWTDTDMEPIHDGQFYECRIEDARPGQMYKYRIYRPDGGSLDHADPYAFYSEKRPGTASIIYDMQQYHFGDQEYMSHRNNFKNRPLNIYEINLGSWRRKDGGEHDSDWQVPADASFGWFRYEEIADLLIPYLKDNHYNCVELMPLNEYPADESWGYQATGFFSATSRYGNPDGLRTLVDKLHQNGIAVIIDLADSTEKIEGYLSRPDFASDCFLSLYRDGKVVPLAMNMNYASEDFRAKTVEGLRAMLEVSGPYYIHCTEGKDRTGFFCLLLEAVSGASYGEIVADYMTTYENYYGILEGSERWDVIVENVLEPMMRQFVREGDLKTADYGKAAEEWLASAGMTQAEIDALRERISRTFSGGSQQ